MKSDKNRHVCEVQIVDDGMLKKRKDEGGHVVYNVVRNGSELLEMHGGMVCIDKVQAAAEETYSYPAAASLRDLPAVEEQCQKYIKEVLHPLRTEADTEVQVGAGVGTSFSPSSSSSRILLSVCPQLFALN